MPARLLRIRQFSSYRQRIENCEYCLTAFESGVPLQSGCFEERTAVAGYRTGSNHGFERLQAGAGIIPDGTDPLRPISFCAWNRILKSLPETSGVQTLQLKRLQDLVNDLVPQRLSLVTWMEF